MKKTYQSNLFFRGRQVIGSQHERNPVPHNSPNPLHNNSQSIDKEDPLVQVDIRDEYSDKHLKYPSIRKGQTKLGLELKITNSLGHSPDHLMKSTSSSRSKGLSEVPFLHVLSLYGSPKSEYEMYQLYHRKKTYDRVRPIEKVPLHLQIPTLSKDEESLGNLGTNFNTTSPLANQSELTVTNLESSLALGINNSSTRQQNSPPKPEIKRNYHKQRAILRDLTCGEPKQLNSKNVKLYVEPATMTYSGAEDIIDDLLNQSGLQNKEKISKVARKEKKDLSLQFDIKTVNKKRIINKGKKIHIEDSNLFPIEGHTKAEISCHRTNKKEKEPFGLDFISPSKGSNNQSAFLQLRRLVAFVPSHEKGIRK